MSHPSTLSSSNRLLHLSDLPNSKKYTQHQISSLLPIHYKTLKQNILTAVHYQSKQILNRKKNSKLIVHDKNLILNSLNYKQIRGGWCDDIDQLDEKLMTQNNYIKQTIKIAVMILNYLSAMVQANISTSSPMKKKQHQYNQEIQNKILSKCQLIKTSIHKYQKFMKRSQSKIINQSRNLNQSVINNLSNSINIQTLNTKYQKLSIQDQDQHQCFIDQKNIIISYNIYKKNKRYIFLTGINNQYYINFFNIINLFRNQNNYRLKITKNLQFNYQKLFRSHVYLQHLFTISRGFIFSSLKSNNSYIDNLIPNCDINDNKKYLKLLTQHIDINKDFQMLQQDIIQKLKQKQPQIFTLLENTLKIYRFSFIYKDIIQTQQQKKIFTYKLIHQFYKILALLCSSIPISNSISYHFHSEHNQKTNRIYFIVLINYNLSLTSMSKSLFLTKIQIRNCLINLCQFINKSTYQEIKIKQKNIADQVFKSSFKIFSKFTENLEKIKINTDRQNYQILKNSSNNLIQSNLSHSRSSPYKKFSQSSTKITHPLTQLNNLNQSKSFQFSKQKSIETTQMQLQYKNLLKSLQQRQIQYELLNPNQIYSFLHNFLQKFKQIVFNNQLKRHQKLVLKFIGKCCNLLTAEEIHSLIDKYKDNSDAILEFFMQQNNFTKMIDVGKLLVKNIQFLFKKYINQNSSFKSIRHNYVINYLKKLIQVYYLNKNKQKAKNLSQSLLIQKSNSPIKNSLRTSKNTLLNEDKLPEVQNMFSQLNMQQLIYLLQKKSYNVPQYKNLVSCHLKEIFNHKPQTPYISSILCHFYVQLVNNDHHQDLVSSFISQIFFEIVHFTNQSTSITLNNNIYRKNNYNLREKKFYEVIRQGGLLIFGYQLRNIFIPQLTQTHQYLSYSNLIVSTIRIEKTNYFKNVIKIIKNSPLTLNFQQIISEIKQKSSQFQAINKQISMPFYTKQIQQQDQEKQKQQILDQKDELQKSLLNINHSQSGIFKQLMKLNPDIKIAGINLKQEYAKKLKKIEDQNNKFTYQYFLKNIINLDIQQAWEYIQLTFQLSDKYKEIQLKKQSNNYSVISNNNSIQNQILYLRESIQHIFTKLSKLYQYIALSDVINACKLQSD